MCIYIYILSLFFRSFDVILQVLRYIFCGFNVEIYVYILAPQPGAELPVQVPLLIARAGAFCAENAPHAVHGLRGSFLRHTTATMDIEKDIHTNTYRPIRYIRIALCTSVA